MWRHDSDPLGMQGRLALTHSHMAAPGSAIFRAVGFVWIINAFRVSISRWDRGMTVTFKSILIALLCWPMALWAGEFADKLAAVSHVLLMRHADAPGVGDPAGYRLDDCTTQRNLGSGGKAQAARTGRWLRDQGIRQARVYSSPWCRCRQTADGLELGPHEVEPSLASFFDRPGQAAAYNQALTAFLRHALANKAGKALILVTHHVNIREYIGENVGSGDMVLVEVDVNGKPLSFRVIGVMP